MILLQIEFTISPRRPSCSGAFPLKIKQFDENNPNGRLSKHDESAQQGMNCHKFRGAKAKRVALQNACQSGERLSA
jgi:hypothetical protein